MTAQASVSPKVGIVIPALNEADSIGKVIAALRNQCHYPVVVVDDCSEDDTVVIASQAGAQVLPLAVRLGAWGATQTGIRYLLQQGCDIVATLDADGQHEPDSLSTLLEPVIKGYTDVAIGTCPERVSRLRLVAWMMMKTTSGLRMEDITSGFRVYNHQASMVLADARATLLDYQDVGVLLRLQAAGLKLLDVPVQMQERGEGSSRIFHSWLVVGRYMLQTLILGLSKRKLGTQTENKK
ncbi:glycosyltransferase family 2 protein [Gilvimarinus sp. 1_MG-2023]|uniref:glycosyltransferase family 2 protein n=1 Tax=Gilvimarinus sp. 1_MG-2023 TaxID=3062638 RepID=UPI0026E1E3C6|nr:glycosyltransferase family 2 protein [Gilvimarinus sp. 1_MG-2023]MDO6746280.1 glycosyltransferase family 2 protein [Gilvimarinus sp. 1_MG-2023]